MFEAELRTSTIQVPLRPALLRRLSAARSHSPIINTVAYVAFLSGRAANAQTKPLCTDRITRLARSLLPDWNGARAWGAPGTSRGLEDSYIMWGTDGQERRGAAYRWCAPMYSAVRILTWRMGPGKGAISPCASRAYGEKTIASGSMMAHIYAPNRALEWHIRQLACLLSRFIAVDTHVFILK